MSHSAESMQILLGMSGRELADWAMRGNELPAEAIPKLNAWLALQSARSEIRGWFDRHFCGELSESDRDAWKAVAERQADAKPAQNCGPKPRRGDPRIQRPSIREAA
jgi:hypothetical protein